MRMLIAVDLSDHASSVVDSALSFATAQDARVDLAFVDERGTTADYLQDDDLRRMVLQEWDAYRVRYDVQLKMLQMRIPEGLRGERLVERGKPAERLLSMAPTYDAIVLGTHGRQGVQRLLMGSVAERVVRSSPVPVIVLPLQGSSS